MIVELSGVNVRVGKGDWPVPVGDRARIDAHWQAITAANPRLWNGRVFGTLAPGQPGGIAVTEDGILNAIALESDFAAFIAWRDWGFPEIGVRNLFGSALILSADGALLYGVMGRHTANAGRIYPPGGSLEPRDVTADGRVDVLRSIELELEEETGLRHVDAEVLSLIAAFDGPRVSVARLFRFDAPAEHLAADIRRFIASEPAAELDDVAVLRAAEDIAAADCPTFAAALAQYVLGN